MSELRSSREKANKLLDDELSSEIFEDWRTFEPDEDSIDEQAEKQIYTNIATKRFYKKRNRVWYYKRMAAIIIPALILICGSIFFYRDHFAKQQTLSTEISTGVNDHASIQLPDGSIVELNGSSSLQYFAEDFKTKSRKINFTGEGYFNIKNIENTPFLVEANGLNVLVTGTSFNLQTYENKDAASISLLSGHVIVTSKLTDEQVELNPNEKAILDNSTGHIDVIKFGHNDNTLGWRTKKLIFENAALSEVIAQIEDYFNCRLTADVNIINERFTGLIPLSDLSTAVSVIEKSFNTSISIEKL